MYQLFVDSGTVADVIDRITDGACAAAPGLDRDACRRLLALIVRVRLRRTDACGTHPDCRPVAALWRGGAVPRGASAHWQDPDPLALPAMFAASAADLVVPPPVDRGPVELRLAAAFRAVVRPLLFRNPNCGHAQICGGEPIFDPVGPGEALDACAPDAPDGPDAQIDGDPETPPRA
jgi:hypothetical protein